MESVWRYTKEVGSPEPRQSTGSARVSLLWVWRSYCHPKADFTTSVLVLGESLTWCLELEYKGVSQLVVLLWTFLWCQLASKQSPVRNILESVHSFNLLLLEEDSRCLMLGRSSQSQRGLNCVVSGSVSVPGSKHWRRTQQNTHLSTSLPSVCLSLALVCVCVKKYVDVRCPPFCSTL